MRNLISFNSTFIWVDKLIDRNKCVNEFINFYDEAKNQDKFYLKVDLSNNPDSIIYELIIYKPFNEIKNIFPWLTPDTYSNLSTFLQIKFTKDISNSISDYNINHEFNESSWMGICSNDLNNYACNISSWKKIHHDYVKNFTQSGRLENKDYFIKFYETQLNIAPSKINSNIKKGMYKDFIRLDNPSQSDGKVVHNQKIHMHLKSGGALNLDGTWKHISNGKISSSEAKSLIELGFILPENL